MTKPLTWLVQSWYMVQSLPHGYTMRQAVEAPKVSPCMVQQPQQPPRWETEHRNAVQV